MSRVFTSRMQELVEQIKPYILEGNPIVWKPDTPDNIMELYEELLKLNKEQRELETKLLF